MYCGECKKECSAEPEDAGYGPGEFWGRPYNDVQWVIKSACCWGIIYKDEGCTQELTYEEWNAEYVSEE